MMHFMASRVRRMLFLYKNNKNNQNNVDSKTNQDVKCIPFDKKKFDLRKVELLRTVGEIYCFYLVFWNFLSPLNLKVAIFLYNV